MPVTLGYPKRKRESLPVDLVDPILEPRWFLEQDHHQDHRCDRDGDDHVEDGKYGKVNQDLRSC